MPPSPPEPPPAGAAAADVVAVDTALRALAPDGVTVGVRPITPTDVERLVGAERDAVLRAVPKRRHEFATGRVLLRRLLGTDEAIPMASDRRPLLPDGVVGSLAHDADLVVAAVSTDRRVGALGVDVEPATTLRDDLARAILRPEEADLDAHLVFVLKEAAYKAWSATGGRLLDHHDVRVDLAADGDHFSALVLADGVVYQGRHRTAGGRHLALVVMPAATPPAGSEGLSATATTP